VSDSFGTLRTHGCSKVGAGAVLGALVMQPLRFRSSTEAVVSTGVTVMGARWSEQTAGDNVRFPNGLRDWFAVNSMIVARTARFSIKSVACTLSA